MSSRIAAVFLAIALAATVLMSGWYVSTYQCPTTASDAVYGRRGASAAIVRPYDSLPVKPTHQIADVTDHVGTTADDQTGHTRMFRAPSMRRPRVVYVDIGANSADTLIALSQARLRHFRCVHDYFLHWAEFGTCTSCTSIPLSACRDTKYTQRCD